MAAPRASSRFLAPASSTTPPRPSCSAVKTGSKRATAKEVRALVADMVAQENHVVAAMGISDGTTDFKKVFRDMGIADRWILTPGNTTSEIRKAFQVFSQSAAAVSAGAWAGGFGN